VYRKGEKMNRHNFLNKFGKTNRPITESAADEYGYRIVEPLRGMTELWPFLKFLQDHEAFICGGYALYSWNPMLKKGSAPPGDLDIYTTNKGKFYEFKESFEQKFKNIYSLNRETKHSYTYNKLGNSWQYGKGSDIEEIQLIKPITTTIKTTTGDNVYDILNNFDITVCQAAVLSDKQILVSKNAYDDAISGQIKLVKNLNPYITFCRVAKYMSKGYRCEVDTMQRIFEFYVDSQERENETGLTLIQEFSKSGVNS